MFGGLAAAPLFLEYRQKKTLEEQSAYHLVKQIHNNPFDATGNLSYAGIFYKSWDFALISFYC